MALFVESDVRRFARELARGYGPLRKAEQILTEQALSRSAAAKYDIFISHSVRDAELILGIKGILESLGYSTYVDWLDDQQLDRKNVNAWTADQLRQRMAASDALFYVTTSNADSSKWMPWECGYFDGLKGKVAIVPIQASSSSNVYNGQEYLGLYPFVVKQPNTKGDDTLWIRRDSSHYVAYSVWIAQRSGQPAWRED